MESEKNDTAKVEAPEMSNARVRWLERTMFAGPQIALVTSQDQLTQGLLEGGAEPLEWNFNTPGCAAITYTHTNGRLVCLIACNSSVLEATEDSILVASTLVHEAVHVYQEYRPFIKDIMEFTSDEFEAYAIQNITYILLEEYARLRSAFVGRESQAVAGGPVQGSKVTVRRGVESVVSGRRVAVVAKVPEAAPVEALVVNRTKWISAMTAVDDGLTETRRTLTTAKRLELYETAYELMVQA